MRKNGDKPKAAPCTTATPTAFQQGARENPHRWRSPCLPASSCRSACGWRDRHRRRLPAGDIRCRRTDLSMDTTRSRRPLEQFLEARNEILAAVQGLDAGPLRDRAGIGGGLGLQLGHRLDQGFGTGAIADAPARHGIGLWRRRSWSGCGHRGGARTSATVQNLNRHRPDAHTCRRSAPRPGDASAVRPSKPSIVRACSRRRSGWRVD